MDKDKNMDSELAASMAYFAASSKAVAFDFASDLAAHSRSNSDQSSDSNRPNTGYFVDHTNRNKHTEVVAVSLALESLEGLHNDCEMESCDH